MKKDLSGTPTPMRCSHSHKSSDLHRLPFRHKDSLATMIIGASVNLLGSIAYDTLIERYNNDISAARHSLEGCHYIVDELSRIEGLETDNRIVTIKTGTLMQCEAGLPDEYLKLELHWVHVRLRDAYDWYIMPAIAFLQPYFPEVKEFYIDKVPPKWFVSNETVRNLSLKLRQLNLE